MGDKHDKSLAKAVPCFKSDMLTKAKDELWQLAAMSTRSTDRVKPQYKVADLTRPIRICDEKRVILPKFVIYEPGEVPILSGEVTFTLTRQVNELHFS